MVETIQMGAPIKPMLAADSGTGSDRYEDILNRHSSTQSELKSDGYRIQVHKGDSLQLFTRSLNELNPEVFPELVGQFDSLPRGIYDGELVGVDDGILGFEAVKYRKRETIDLELVEQYPLHINFFDVLQYEGVDTVSRPLGERRNLLEKNVDQVTDSVVIGSASELESRYTNIVEAGYEGLVCKNLDSPYMIGKKTDNWMKVKKFITLDLVVLGLYEGKGKAAKLPFSGMVLGTRNGDKYETITKVGISNVEKISEIYFKVQKHLSSDVPESVVFSSELEKKTYERKVPVSYVDPRHSPVVEVRAMNVTQSKNWHSCGYGDVSGKAYSLRIPVVERLRPDKVSVECTTTDEIWELYGR